MFAHRNGKNALSFRVSGDAILLPAASAVNADRSGLSTEAVVSANLGRSGQSIALAPDATRVRPITRRVSSRRQGGLKNHTTETVADAGHRVPTEKRSLLLPFQLSGDFRDLY